MSDNNNQNNDDIEDLDIDDFDDSGFDDYSEKGTLADLWKNNPMVKVGVILAVFVVIVAGVILFGDRGEAPNVSRVTGGKDVTETPGTSEVTPAFQDAIEEENVRRTEEALQRNQSAVPMPVEPPKGQIPLQMDGESEEDPMERWRRMQEERIRQQQIVAQDYQEPEAEPPPDTRTPAVNALSQAMSTQMEAVLQSQPIKGANMMKITDPAYLDKLEAKRREEQMAMAEQVQEQQSEQDSVENVLVTAGTIEYGQLLIEANTDAPGPVLAQIVSGPYRGSRILGTFEATRNYLVLTFKSMNVNGKTIGVDAIAIDPDTTLPGMVTEIDRRYFSRILLPMAAEFIEGVGEAVADSGTTTITINGDTVSESTSDKDSDQEIASGIEEAGETASDLLREEADQIEPLLRIAAGTPIGIMFVSDVIENAPIESDREQYPGYAPFPQYGIDPYQMYMGNGQ